MKIQYISDIHLDFYVKSYNEPKIEKIFHKFIDISLNADVLIIAGDLSHYSTESKYFIEYALNFFKKVFVTSGNHEMYNISKSQRKKYTNTYSRINELKEMISKIDNAYFLDGDIVKYNGIKFGGAMGWYDGSYYNKIAQGTYMEPILTKWNLYTNDSNLIPMLTDFNDVFKIEIEKIKKVLELKPDIMITHFSPVSEGINFNNERKIDLSSAFYCFDGLNLVDTDWIKNTPKYWISGHIHDTKEFKIFDTEFVRNPIGYPGENKIVQKLFEL